MRSEDIKAVAHELAFWKEFVKTDRFLKGWVAACKTPELHHDAYKFIYDLVAYGKPPIKVLDVGSGVVSILNGILGLDITACDPLGPLYEVIFDYKKHGISPCLPYAGEELPFNQDFDIAHCSNAIDHCEYPEDVFENLFNSVKRGGYVIIQCFEDEADFEKGQGFHKYNIRLNKQDKNVIEYRHINYEHYVPFENYQTKTPFGVVKADTYKLDTGKNWIIWIAKRTG